MIREIERQKTEKWHSSCRPVYHIKKSKESLFAWNWEPSSRWLQFESNPLLSNDSSSNTNNLVRAGSHLGKYHSFSSLSWKSLSLSLFCHTVQDRSIQAVLNSQEFVVTVTKNVLFHCSSFISDKAKQRVE